MNTEVSAKRNSRVALLQGLTPASLGDIDLEATRAWLDEKKMLLHIDKKHFRACLGGVAESLTELDQLYQPYLKGRELTELGQVERTILRIATFELTRLDIPFRVVINEWIDIAKEFGATDSFKFINGVLDQLAKAHQV